MTTYRTRFGLTAGLIFLLGFGAAIAQPPQEDAKKKEEPPTKEELELRQGSRDFLYKFTEGEEIHSEARQKRIEHRNHQGKLRTETRELQLKLVLSVGKVLPKGVAEVNGRVVHVKYNRIGAEIKKYDSLREKNADDASDGWELLTDAKFKFTVDSRGAVSNLQPDAETAAFWNQQPRPLRAMVSEDANKTLLPFISLPTDLVRRGTDWKEKRTFLDESFGKREVTLNFSYHGSQQISGRTYQDIRLRAEAKQVDAKPTYEILEHHGDGQVSFDMVRGNLREFRFNESYLFNPPGSELVEPEDEKEKEKKKKKASYGGGRGGGAGMGGPAGGGDLRMAKKKKEESKQEKDESDLKPVNKSVKLILEHEVRLTYRGRPVSGE
jgi:hypothetical protein